MQFPGGGTIYNRIHILCHFVYISMLTSRGLQQLLGWISILRSLLRVFILKTEGFYA
jgi:hypothetical protein